jgi:hypothetical protein
MDLGEFFQNEKLWDLGPEEMPHHLTQTTDIYNWVPATFFTGMCVVFVFIYSAAIVTQMEDYAETK